MAHNINPNTIPLKAASAIGQYVPVAFLAGGSALSETVIRAGSINDDVVGMTIATVASPGDEVAVAFSGQVKGIAGASLGAGARVAVGSTNGILIPLAASGGPASVNVVATRYSVGRAAKNAAAGDLFPVILQPEQIV